MRLLAKKKVEALISLLNVVFEEFTNAADENDRLSFGEHVTVIQGIGPIRNGPEDSFCYTAVTNAKH